MENKKIYNIKLTEHELNKIIAQLCVTRLNEKNEDRKDDISRIMYILIGQMRLGAEKYEENN